MSAIDNPLTPSPPIDRVRLIRRSTRCFLFGLVGAIPCFGLGMAWLAIKLYRSLAAEAGETVRVYPLFLASAYGWCLAMSYLALDLPEVALGGVMAALAFEYFFIWWQYRRNAPAEWNPARGLMYWGLGLANAGLILTSVVLTWAIYLVNL